MKRRRLQELVIRTSPWPPFRWLYFAVYAVALAWLTLRVRRFREIRALDLRLPEGGHCFGSSDLDLHAQTDPLAPREFFALANRLADVLLAGGTWLRIFDLYAFPAAEYELQVRVARQSSARGGRRVRLLGRRSSMPAADRFEAVDPDDACLGRATYDCSSLCQELVESPLGLHHTRLIYRRVVRIEGELRARAEVETESALSRAVLAAARGPALHGRVRPASFEALARAHGFALARTTELARAIPRDPRSRVPRISPVQPAQTPDVLDAATRGCRDPIAALCEERPGALHAAVLGGVPCSRYEHRIYLVARDDLPIDEHVELMRAVRDLFATGDRRVSRDYLRLRSPVVLSCSLWRAADRWYHALRPVEEQVLLRRHGVVLWGEELLGELLPPSDEAYRRSAAIGVADLRNRVWGALYHRQAKHLADLLAGRIPALWLLLAGERVATSPAEACSGCAEIGMPHVDVVAKLNERLAGCAPADLPPVDAPFWQPALAAIGDWLDPLVEMALAAVRPSASEDASLRPDSPSAARSRASAG